MMQGNPAMTWRRAWLLVGFSDTNLGLDSCSADAAPMEAGGLGESHEGSSWKHRVLAGWTKVGARNRICRQFLISCRLLKISPSAPYRGFSCSSLAMAQTANEKEV